MSQLVIAVEAMLMGSVVDDGMSRNDLDERNVISRRETCDSFPGTHDRRSKIRRHRTIPTRIS